MIAYHWKIYDGCGIFLILDISVNLCFGIYFSEILTISHFRHSQASSSGNEHLQLHSPSWVWETSCSQSKWAIQTIEGPFQWQKAED